MSLVSAFGPRAMILLAVGVAVFVALVPPAITTLFDVNTTGWSTGAVALFTVIPIVILAVLVLALMPAGNQD